AAGRLPEQLCWQGDPLLPPRRVSRGRRRPWRLLVVCRPQPPRLLISISWPQLGVDASDHAVVAILTPQPSRTGRRHRQVCLLAEREGQATRCLDVRVRPEDLIPVIVLVTDRHHVFPRLLLRQTKDRLHIALVLAVEEDDLAAIA